MFENVEEGIDTSDPFTEYRGHKHN